MTSFICILNINKRICVYNFKNAMLEENICYCNEDIEQVIMRSNNFLQGQFPVEKIIHIQFRQLQEGAKYIMRD